MPPLPLSQWEHKFRFWHLSQLFTVKDSYADTSMSVMKAANERKTFDFLSRQGKPICANGFVTHFISHSTQYHNFYYHLNGNPPICFHFERILFFSAANKRKQSTDSARLASSKRTSGKWVEEKLIVHTYISRQAFVKGKVRKKKM